MTFSLSLDEHVEGHLAFSHSKTRLNSVLVAIELFAGVGYLWVMVVYFDQWFWAVLLFFAGSALRIVGQRFLLKARFRRPGLGREAPVTVCAEPEGLRRLPGGYLLPWENLEKPLEARNVWVLAMRDPHVPIFIVPKRVLRTSEGAQEWALVQECCGRFCSAPDAPPIARP